MNVEKLAKFADILIQDDSENKISQNFEKFNNCLVNFSQNSQVPQYQTEFTNARDELFNSLERSIYNSMSFLEQGCIDSIGGENILGSSLKKTIKEILEQNQMTPVEAKKTIDPIWGKYNNFIKNIKQLSASFSALNIENETIVEDNEGEIAFMFPREIIDGELNLFYKDINTFQNFMNILKEISGEENYYHLSTISSSNFIIFLTVSCGLIKLVASTINEVLAVFKNYMEIRKTCIQMKEQKFPQAAISKAEEHLDSVLEKSIDKIVDSVIKQYKKSDKNRKNELKNNLKISLQKVFAKIDNGYQINVSFDIECDENENEESSEESENSEIQTLQEEIKNLNTNVSNLAKEIANSGQILQLPAFSQDEKDEVEEED